MAISSYKKNEVKFFRVHVEARGKVSSNLRLQRSRKNIPTLREALSLKKSSLRALLRKWQNLKAVVSLGVRLWTDGKLKPGRDTLGINT